MAAVVGLVVAGRWSDLVHAWLEEQGLVDSLLAVVAGKKRKARARRREVAREVEKVEEAELKLRASILRRPAQ